MSYTKHLLRYMRRSVGENIRTTRMKKKITLRRLSRETDISICRLDHYEMGKNELTFDDIIKIACALNVEIDALMQ